PSEGHFDTTVNQTRLRLATTTPTEFGDVNGYIEMDFYGEGGRDLRRRLAYIQWQNWTIGRAWSTFSDFNYGTTLFFNGPEGQVNQRAELVRYTFDLGNDSAFDISLENFSDASLNGSGTAFTEHQLPGLAMRYQGAAGMFNYQAAGLVRKNSFDGGPASPDGSTVGWGLNLGGSMSLDSGTTLMLSTLYGEGINDGGFGYTLLPGTNYVDTDGDIENNSLWGATGSISQKITDKLTGNLIYSYTNIEA